MCGGSSDCGGCYSPPYYYSRYCYPYDCYDPCYDPCYPRSYYLPYWDRYYPRYYPRYYSPICCDEERVVETVPVERTYTAYETRPVEHTYTAYETRVSWRKRGEVKKDEEEKK